MTKIIYIGKVFDNEFQILNQWGKVVECKAYPNNIKELTEKIEICETCGKNLAKRHKSEWKTDVEWRGIEFFQKIKK